MQKTEAVKNAASSNGILGKQVLFPIDDCQWGEGVVVEEDSEGRVVVQEECGTYWKGWEYQVTLL